MSRSQRLGVVALVVAIAVAAFVIAKPGGDDDSSKQKAGKTTTSAKQETKTSEQATKPEQPAVDRVVLKNDKPVGGVRDIKLKTGDIARIEVSVDKPNKLHLHGYDIEKNAKPGKPAKFRFKANAEGVFELESHTLEDAGKEAALARVVVEPS